MCTSFVAFNWARPLLFSCFVACLVPSSFFKNHANLFFLMFMALTVLYCCGLFCVPLCASSCSCHCVREAFVVVHGLCCLLMLLLFFFFFGCLYFGFLHKPTLFQRHLLPLFIFVLRLFFCWDHFVPVVFLYKFLFLLLLLLCFNQKSLSCLSMPRRFC